MVLDTRSRLATITIGGQDWSAQLLHITTTRSKIKQGEGTLPVTGTLSLVNAGTLPSSFDPRSNTLWRPGTAVTVDIPNSSGTPTRSPHGHLYILKTLSVARYPDFGEVQTLDIEVGCQLALKDYTESDGNESGVALGSSTNRSDIINSLFTYLGIPALSTPITDYPLSAPVTKQGGSYVQLAGELAYGAKKLLYQDGQGATQLDDLTKLTAVASPTPTFTITLGQDDLDYQPLQGAEVPADIVKVVGEAQFVTLTVTGSSIIERTFGPASSVSPDLGEGTVLLEEVETTESQAGSKRTQRIQRTKPRASVISDDVFDALETDGGSKLTPTLDEDTEIEWSYAGGEAGKLSSITKKTNAYAGKALAGFIINNPTYGVNPYTLLETYSSTTTYSYELDDTTKRVEEREQELLGAIAPAADYESNTISPLLPTESAATVQQWRKVNARDWEHKTSYSESRSRVDPSSAPDDPSAAAALISSRSDRIVRSSSGQADPPAAERKPPTYQIETQHVDGEAQNTGGINRPRTFQQNWLVAGDDGRTQAQELAAIEFAKAQAEWLGATLETDLRDEWFTAPPLAPIKVVEDGVSRYFLTNGVAISITQEQAKVACDLLWIGDGVAVPPGSAPGGGDEIVVPAISPSSKASMGWAFGMEARSSPYPLLLPASNHEIAWAFAMQAVSYDRFSQMAWAFGMEAETVEIAASQTASVTWEGDGAIERDIETVGFEAWAMLIIPDVLNGSRQVYDQTRLDTPYEFYRTDANTQETQGSLDAYLSNGITITTSLNVNLRDHYGYFITTGTAFDIVSYAASASPQAVPHNLGSPPDLIVVRRTNSSSWRVYHSSLGATKALTLDTNVAEATSATYWNDAAPDSDNFYVGSDFFTNFNGGPGHIAYLFKAQAGVLAFGSYPGNGDPAGPSVTGTIGTGGGAGEVSVLIKRADSSGHWNLFSTLFDASNPRQSCFELDTATAITTGNGSIDINSDGFQVVSDNVEVNANGGTYIYVIFKES